MSQWGANGMAKKGSNYKEILKHFYTGVDIGQFTIHKGESKTENKD